MDEIRQSEETKQPGNHRRKVAAAIIFAILAVIGVVIVYFYLQYKNTHISTDDAFVDGGIHTVASRVQGSVAKVYVTDNQFIKKGDVLVELDPADYDVKVQEAASGLDAERARIPEINARIEATKRQVSEMKAAVEAARANLELQEANLRQAEIDINRAENLYKKDAVSKERYDRATTGYKVAAAQVKAAGEQLKQTEKAMETQSAFIRQAEASRVAQLSSIKQREAVMETAKLNYAYTKIYAPVDGYITKKSVEVGNQIKEGQPLMAVVPLGNIWVTANYKETQLDKVKTGQKVEIKVDTYPDRTFKGKVDSIMAGTGSTFSLFPPENATGNYVKVVQRVPVKIVLDQDTDKEHVLRIGMSVVPTIIVR